MWILLALVAATTLLWGAVQALAARQVRLALTPDGDFRAAHRLNTSGLLIGLLSMLLSLAVVPAGLVGAFGELDATSPEDRAAYLSERINTVMSIGGLVGIVGVAVGVAAIVLWVLRKRKLVEALSHEP